MIAVKDRIRAKARDLGFPETGFAAALGRPQWRRNLTDWLAEGRQGDMAWMAENADRRTEPRTLWPEAKSAVVLAMPYGVPGDPLSLLAHPERGSICAYARNRDYHDLVKKRLKMLAGWMVAEFGGEVKVFVDTAPVMEKPLAQEAGLGWGGRHTNLVSRRLGSWFVLSEILTTLDIPPDAPESDHCGRCRACQDACPTGAIEGPGRLDPRRCISYLTIEHKGHIPAGLRAAMGNRVYGCDDCLAACPWNKFAPPTREADFFPRAELAAPLLADLVRLDDSGFRQVFAGSPVKRVGRDRFVRNVLIAIGNSGRSELAAVARDLVEDQSPLVRAMAVWALKRLGTAALIAECRGRRMAVEDDAAVLAEWESG
ncbi:MAG: tRNA epoxyqueuosine(34) reductase QueG [Magnetospirillum sp.]|nr:tRNA epoxyqueuosine(34) reductase QueG [Magnetospirillum sp.]